MEHWFVGGIFVSGDEPALESFKRQHLIEHEGRFILDFEGAVPVPEVFQTICYEPFTLDGRVPGPTTATPMGERLGFPITKCVSSRLNMGRGS